MAHPVIIKNELWDIVDSTKDLSVMPNMKLNANPIFPAIYIDELGTYTPPNTDPIARLTLFLLDRQLPWETLLQVEQQLGRKTTELERQERYIRRLHQHQQRYLFPILEYLISILTGDLNGNLPQGIKFPYALRQSRLGVIDEYTESNNHTAIAKYNQYFGVMQKLVGAFVSVELTGGNSMFCGVPCMLSTDWQQLSNARKAAIPVHHPGTSPTTITLLGDKLDLPSGGQVVNRENYPPVGREHVLVQGKRIMAAIRYWHNMPISTAKENLEAEILALLGESFVNKALMKMGDYFIIINR